MIDEDIFDLPLLELAPLLRDRKLSSPELTAAMLQRIETRDAELHAFVRVTAERAMADADRAEREIAGGGWRGPLHGVPIAIKDIFDTRGIETEVGTSVMAGRVPDEDATAVARLAAAGAVLLGKLAMTEGAYSEHRPERPEPRNPWSVRHWTGVSSSGSGVAVAAGLAFAALGTDTGGSIRFPCAACGVTGLKPGWDRVSRHGVFPLAPSLDHVGPMARTAADCAALFGILPDPDPADSTARPEPGHVAGQSRPTVGFDPVILAGVHPAVGEAVERAIALFGELGFELREVAMPPLEPFARGWALTCGVEAAIVHADLFARAPDEYGPALRALIEMGQSVPARDYAELHLARLDFAVEMAKLHRQADVIAVPALPIPTPQLAMLAAAGNDPEQVSALLRFTAPFNYSGQPSLTLPAGFDPDGLPIGLQLVGPLLSEARLLEAGIAFQAATDWHRRRPPDPAAPAASALAETDS